MKLGILLLTAAILLLPSAAQASRTPYEWAQIDLDYILEEKADKLTAFMDRAATLAAKAPGDPVLAKFFSLAGEYPRALQQKGDLRLDAEYRKLMDRFLEYYAQEYFFFYDMLFVDGEGTVFYSVRNETDRGSNVFSEGSVSAKLGQALRERPSEEQFIDFFDYPPSNEEAAFFIQPLTEGGRHKGWIIFQLALNRLNHIFSISDESWGTLESFLVNRGGRMLTESRFRPYSTSSHIKLSQENFRTKFTEKSGHLEVTDYRDTKALTSFRVLDFHGVEWLLIVKVDKSEVTTREYLLHRRYYYNKLKGILGASGCPQTEAPAANSGHGNTTRVDMDEYAKTTGEGALETWGVSTCAGLVATYPGRFAYLAHISNRDAVFGGQDTTLLNEILNKIRNFDVSSAERRNVVFHYVAPHLDALGRVITTLVSDGYFLSQIDVVYCPTAQSALISCTRGKDLHVTWKMNDGRELAAADDTPGQNVGAIVQNLITPVQ